MPEIIALRAKVEKKGLLPAGKFKDLQAVNQWLGKKYTDDDTALLTKKVKFLADSLQRTIGGTQGGQWAFEVAADILDPTFPSTAFARIVQSHGKSVRRMSEEYRTFGKTLPTGPPEPGGDVSGMTDEELLKALGD